MRAIGVGGGVHILHTHQNTPHTYISYLSYSLDYYSNNFYDIYKKNKETNNYYEYLSIRLAYMAVLLGAYHFFFSIPSSSVTSTHSFGIILFSITDFQMYSFIFVCYFFKKIVPLAHAQPCKLSPRKPG